MKKSKLYELIGRCTVLFVAWGISVFSCYHLILYILDNCCTTLR